MDIDELRTVQTKERQKDSLQHLRDSFYEDVAAYIEELKQRRTEAAEAADDPFSDPEVSQLTDEIETAEDVVEAVYERRVGKVVKLASFAAADMPVDEEGLTAQERDLFEDLVGRIGENKDRVLDILAGEGDTGPAAPTGSAPVGGAPSQEPTDEPAHRGPEHVAGGPEDETTATDDSATGPAAAEETPSRAEPAVATGSGDDAPATGSGPEDAPPAPPEAPPEEAPPEEAPPEEALAGESGETEPSVAEEPPAGESRGRPDGGVTADEERTTVRITADVGQLLGMDDREYDLQSEDVVSLPEENADALLQREAAEEL